MLICPNCGKVLSLEDIEQVCQNCGVPIPAYLEDVQVDLDKKPHDREAEGD
jgi:rRNA maturation endonuclease Nob1